MKEFYKQHVNTLDTIADSLVVCFKCNEVKKESMIFLTISVQFIDKISTVDKLLKIICELYYDSNR